MRLPSLKVLVLCGLVLLASYYLAAQEQSGATSARGANAPTESEKPSDKVPFASGTPVRLVMKEAVSSKTAKVGDAVELQVLGDVKVGELVVIANKAPASATITQTRRAGMPWHAGRLGIHLDFVTLVDQQKVPLQGQGVSKGEPTDAANDWSQAIVESGGGMILLLPFAPLQKGNEAVFPKGMTIAAATSRETLLDRATVLAAQPPLVEQAKHAGSVVTIYFPHHRGAPSSAIWCGLANLGKLHSGRRLTVTLPAGRYFFHLGTRGSYTMLEAEDGSEHYLRVVFTELLRGGSSFEMAEPEHDVGELEASDALPENSANLPDIARLDKTQLQAQPPPQKHH